MCILIIGSGNVKAYASNKECLEMQYVLEVLNGYLIINDELNYCELSLSTQRHIYNLDGTESGKNYYMLLSENSVIGMIVVEKINDNFCSYFTTQSADTLSSLYVEGESFVLSLECGNIILVTEYGYEILINNYSGGESLTVDTAKLLDKLTVITMIDISNSPAMISSNSTYSVAGNPPPLVGNRISPNNMGLCWAACVASVINYYNGNSDEGAYSVFEDCWNTVECSEDNIPSGTTEWILTAFSINGINDITYIEDSLSYGEICTTLGTDSRPIIACIYGETVAHSVVIFEYSIIGSNGYYLIMDPNYDSYVTVSLNYDSLNNTSYFPYTPSNSTSRYTRWEASYY